MSGGENAKPTNVDPRSIQDSIQDGIQKALRMYLQPIKNDDPMLDFYTMYKRETTEYDTEYMQKYNEDLNTTLIFAGLFSAVSSAFVIDVQSQLQPDSSERSEAYLRAILLSLNRSIIPNEDPAAPSAWNGPSAEIVTTSNLLYASLLMSLLAAFVAMLGKQWLNRYLRHTGGSMVERCGDRQRKFDGLEKWPFRLFIESLPIMLQIALLLLACGLSRSMWSVNTSVARVIISFTVFGILFYIGIVAAGTSSYECPFQTPASIGLRYLRDNKTTRKLLANLSLPKVISFIHTTWKSIRRALRRVYDITRSPLSWEISPSRIGSGIRSTATKVGHQTIILLLRVDQVFRNAKQRLVQGFKRTGLLPTAAPDTRHRSGSGIRSTATKIGYQTIILLLRADRAFGNAKQRLVQAIQRLRRTPLLPITVGGTHRRPVVPRTGPGLLIRVRNLESIRRQNAANACCVSWVLRNITDPEAIDSAVRLAGTIRWFDGDPNHDPPFDLIVSTFEACFDSTKQLYPGMRDRAYFSAQAILQINTGARARSCECVSKYPIPAVSFSSVQHTDADLHHVIYMLKYNSRPGRSTLYFPEEGTNTHAHTLWMSNLFVDLTRVGPNPTLRSHMSYLSAAFIDHRAVVSNTLLVWDMLLGGHIEEETIWAVDKSDSLETILSHLSTTVIDVIADGNCLEDLHYLLEFLAAWEKRPECLTPIAYQWCSVISKAAGRLEWDKRAQYAQRVRLRPQDPAIGEGLHGFQNAEWKFAPVGRHCDFLRLDGTSRRAHGPPRAPPPGHYVDLLPTTLEIGFRLVTRRANQPTIHLDHTPHHGQMFETVFANGDDDLIADAVSVWVVDNGRAPPGLCARYLAERMERDKPFSPRLRRVSIQVIECFWHSGLGEPGPETVCLLNHLEVDVDDTVEEYNWAWLLAGVLCSPIGLESLSPHYWCLLGKLALGEDFSWVLGQRKVEVMGSLEKAEDWEKLEVWMVVIWQSLDVDEPVSMMEDINQVTLKLLSRRLSALPRFEELCERGSFQGDHKDHLRQICDQARAEQSPSELPPPLQMIHAQPLVPLLFLGDDTF